MHPIKVLLKRYSQFTFAASFIFATVVAARAQTAPRVWQVPDPLYQSLLGGGPPGLSREGVIVWGHNLANVNVLRQTARRLGTDYSLEEMHHQAGQYQMRIFGQIESYPKPKDLTPEQSQAWDNDNVKYIYMLRNTGIWAIDPKVVDSAMTQLDQVLTDDAGSLWGISGSDEVISQSRQQGAELMANPPKDYPYLQQADDEVRTKFGGGKWGIPHGKTDANPYRWIAFNKWLNVKFHERSQRMREVVEKHHLNIHLISFDPLSVPSGNDFSGIADDFDIFTHQTYSPPNPWRATAGFFTKFLVDLTGKDVWPCVHVENYAFATTPLETREMLSQVFRNGGSGFHFYWPDTAGPSKLVGDMRLSYFGSPRRYNTILNIIKTSQTMPKLRFPQNSREAILYNDDMLQSSLQDIAGTDRTPWFSTEACYTFLGPVARSWFTFIDDSKVLSQSSLNQQFDTIYVPIATYQRPEIVAKLRAFVQNGGTLICGDANAFSTDTIGNDTSAQRQQIFGVETGGKITPKVLSVTVNNKSYTLPVTSGAVQLKTLDGTRVLGTFDDGSPAITAHALGSGQAILFAANPFNFDAIPKSQWRDFFTAVAAQLKDPVGLDIWRFQFPDSDLGKDIPVPPGVCLTNNHVTWQEEKPVTMGNVDLQRKYQLQPPPDNMPDATGDAQGWISFAGGHLTDRRQSMLDPKTSAKAYVGFKNPDSLWMDSWKSTSTVALTFDLQKPMMPNTVKFWFDDTMPTFTVEGSNDLQLWQPLGENTKTLNAGEDVLDVSVSLHATAPYRYVRVIFSPRETGQKLTLVESEVWGTP